MNYVERITIELRKLLPNEDRVLIDLYVLLALTNGSSTTRKDVHDAWSVWKNGRLNQKEHPSLVPFDQLSEPVKELDMPFVEKIREAIENAAYQEQRDLLVHCRKCDPDL